MASEVSSRAPASPYVVLAICCMSILMVGLDTTILNVALPEIRRDLDASIAGAQWTIAAFTVVVACLLVLGGSSGDRFGRRRVFQIGLLSFTLGSLLCSIATSIELLVAFRMVQAIGGSMLNPVALSIVSNTFSAPAARARAIGWWGATAGVSIAAGPVLGGLLVHGIGWRSIFWLNIPVGLAAIALTARYVPESRSNHPRRFDPVGQALVIATLGLLVFGIIEAPSHGWGSAPIVACFVGSGVALAALITYELRRREPLIDPRLFSSAPLSGACVVSICAFVVFGGFLFLNTIYLQDVRGYSALHTGIALAPMALTMMVCSPISGRVVGRYGPRPSLLFGSTMIIAAGLVSALPEGDPSDAHLLVSFVLVGAGLGGVNAAITTTAVAGLPLAQAGVAAALASTTRQVGVALGVAVVGSIIAEQTQGAGAAGFTHAAHLTWWLVTGCGVAALAVTLATTGARGRRTARPPEVVRHERATG